MTPKPSDDKRPPPPELVAYYLLERKLLADKLRHIEAVLEQAGAINRRLCAPPRMR